MAVDLYICSADDLRYASSFAIWSLDRYIIQKTRIKLDEEGVEAAAVTFIGMDEKGLAVPNEPKVFNADRPFSFYIYATCNDTTAMMFAGEIVE